VTATDQGATPLSGKTDVIITITDVNDNPPVWEQALYEATLSEVAIIGTAVVAVSASDADAGNNGAIAYDIISIVGKNGEATDKFKLDSRTGLLRSASTFDLDAGESDVYTLTVQAADAGVPAKTVTTEVIVHIQDINEFDPVFEQQEYMADIAEDAAVNVAVVSVRIKDKVGSSFSCQPPLFPSLAKYRACIGIPPAHLRCRPICLPTQ